MDLLITTQKGFLTQNKKILKNIKYFSPVTKYVNGDLTTAASIKNIHSICESIMGIFVRPMGFKANNSDQFKISELDVGKKYTNIKYPPTRNENNLTRGWCYLISGVIHRFFYKNFDLYKVPCPLDISNRDYHWWLESKCRKYIIDLTEEQYLNEGIKDIRKNGYLAKTFGHTYGEKTRFMSFIVATYNFPNATTLKDIQLKNYLK